MLPVEAVLMRGAVPCRVVSVVFLTLVVWTLGVISPSFHDDVTDVFPVTYSILEVFQNGDAWAHGLALEIIRSTASGSAKSFEPRVNGVLVFGIEFVRQQMAEIYLYYGSFKQIRRRRSRALPACDFLYRWAYIGRSALIGVLVLILLKSKWLRK